MIDHDGRLAAIYGHDDFCKALLDKVDLGLLRKPCLHSIVKGKEGQENMVEINWN